jgi:hypothetical protein
VMEPKRAGTNATTADDHEESDGHYCMRKYSCWYAGSLVRGHGCVSRHKFLDVPGCLRSKLTVWKEEQFTVLPFQGIDLCKSSGRNG